jgi:ubiquinol-cytochrome c reductase cytochrome b subunit
VGTNVGPLVDGAKLFNQKGCEFCHEVAGYGGHRGPSLTWVGDRLTRSDLTVRIMNGGYNMPAFAGLLDQRQLEDLVVFLESRRKER